jgi:Putative zinc-finger
MTQAEHPEELLAEYVEGSLEPDDRGRVESHIATCVSCREEVALAGSARQALGALPELDVPAGTTWPVVQRAGQRRRWLPSLSPRAAWATAGAAAVAAAVIGGFIVVGGPGQLTGGRSTDSAGESAGVEAPQENMVEGATPAPTRGATYPSFRLSDRNYNGTSIGSLARDLTREARTALDEGFPEPPARFYTQTALLASDDRTRRALSCLVEAVSPDRSLAPFTVVAGKFDGEPAYIGAFLQADRPDRPYRHLAVYVVSRDGCALRSFARQQL